MDSNKSINVTLKYVDPGYSFIKVYYSRTSAAADENRVASAFEIVKTYPINNQECNIVINGDEEKTQIPLTDLSQQLTIVNSSESEVQIANRLFLGNVSSQELYYSDLTNLSLHVIPYVRRKLSETKIGRIDPKDYTDTFVENYDTHTFSHEYYNTKNIYYNVGYWNEEYYRLGIVYIFEDGSLSPVFNTLGYETFNPEATNREKNGVLEDNSSIINTIVDESKFDITEINYNDNGYIDTPPSFLNLGETNNEKYIVKNSLNAKGVIRINDDEIKNYDVYIPEKERLNKENVSNENIPGNYIYNLGVYIHEKLITELKKYCVKGFFIVRQKRIPTILAQGFTMPWDKEAKVPIIEYWGKRHDFSRGITVSNKGGGTDDGIPYTDTNPVKEPLYLGKYTNGTFYPVSRRCDVVESFLQ